MSAEERITKAVEELKELRDTIVNGIEQVEVLCTIDHIVGFTLQE